jgi:DNA-binding NarL/FixJ family response regulator
MRHPADTRPAPAIQVALVEDDPLFASALAQAINAAPDMALGPVLATRAEALGLVQAGPAPDVLLVDLGLPDGSGLDVIRAATLAWPRCSVMVSTALADDAHVLASIEAGASGYLLKDAAPTDIACEIRALHAGGSPISPLVARRVLQRLRRPDAQAPLVPAAPAGTADEADAPRSLLSPRETQVLELAARGHTYDEIAQRLDVSGHTVATFVRRIYAKLDVRTKVEALNAARLRGLLDRPPSH